MLLLNSLSQENVLDLAVKLANELGLIQKNILTFGVPTK